MSELRAFAHFGFPVFDLPLCGCGNDFVELRVELEVINREIVLVGHICCDECGFEPDFRDSGSDASSWHDALLRCINAWSAAFGGSQYSRVAALPDQLEELVSAAELSLGSLPEFRARTLARYLSRGLQ